MNKKRLISMVLLVAFLSVFSFETSSYGINKDYELNSPCDAGVFIDPAVYDAPRNEEGKVLVLITTEAIPECVINEQVKSLYGYDSSVYDDERTYNETILPKIVSRIAADPDNVTEEENRLILKAVSSDYDDYIMARRSAVKGLYSALNGGVLEKTNISDKDILYCGWYTASIIAYIDDDCLEALKDLNGIVSVEVFADETAEPELSVIHDQVHTDNVTGTNSSNYYFGEGLTGEGVKIGIIELENGVFNPNAPQLVGIPSNRLNYVVNYDDDSGVNPITPTLSDHATMMTTIIVGQAVTVSGRVYKGIVPDATIYATSCHDNATILRGMSYLADAGVSVINFSGGVGCSYSYKALDKNVDALIANTRVTIVKSAGNSGNNDPNGSEKPGISSPGKAFNIITVGNAQTKSNAYTSMTTPYAIHPSSSYGEVSYIANKPDVCAPGTYVAYVSSGTTVYGSGIGTSSSAAITTGIVAQMHQQKPYLKTNPNATKACLIVGASNSVVSTTNNDFVDAGCFLIRNRSGAGFVNAVNSVSAAGSYNYGYLNINLKTITNGTYLTLCNWYFQAGKKVRMVMTYEVDGTTMPAATGHRNNIDLYLYNSGGTVVSSSSNAYTNVEILEYTIPTSGYYTIKIQVVDHITSSEDKYVQPYVVWIED